MKKPLVSVIMGSDSDLGVMKETLHLLQEFDIPYEVKILSAHRSPKLAWQFAKTAERRV